MGYYDGNTVTAIWNYAQNFAMSDNHYGTTFGPSTPEPRTSSQAIVLRPLRTGRLKSQGPGISRVEATAARLSAIQTPLGTRARAQPVRRLLCRGKTSAIF